MQSLDKHSGDLKHNDGSPPQRNPRLVEPPGFKEICTCMGKFSERKGDDDFSLWHTDFEKATGDFTWSNEACVT